MKKNILSGGVLFTAMAALVISCSKPASNLFLPPSQAKFMGETTQSYQLQTDPPPAYPIRVGVTAVTDQDRTVTIAITSASGAVQGTHYNVSGLGTGNTVTIPAGELFTQFIITGEYDEYTSGRRDTLTIALTQPGMEVAQFNDTIQLILRGPCFDGAVTEEALNELLGTYNNSVDAGFFDWGPYTTRVVSITPLTATTARAIINNVWDYDFGDIAFIMDWTDPDHTVINVEAPTVTPADAGILNSAYAGMNLVVRAAPSTSTAANNFSICNTRINLRYQLGVYDPGAGAVLGYFATVATTVMRK